CRRGQNRSSHGWQVVTGNSAPLAHGRPWRFRVLKRACTLRGNQSESVRASARAMKTSEEITPSGRIVEEQLDCHLHAIERAFGGDSLAFVGPLFFGVDEAIRDAIEWIHRRT